MLCLRSGRYDRLANSGRIVIIYHLNAFHIPAPVPVGCVHTPDFVLFRDTRTIVTCIMPDSPQNISVFALYDRSAYAGEGHTKISGLEFVYLGIGEKGVRIFLPLSVLNASLSVKAMHAILLWCSFLPKTAETIIIIIFLLL